MGDHLVIMGDINDDIESDHIQTFFSEHHMTNVINEMHPSPNSPTTYAHTSSCRKVDGIWVTPGLHIERCGYTKPGLLTGDHSFLWADISYDSALGHDPPMPQTPDARRLQLYNTKVVQKYLTLYRRLIAQHNIASRQFSLEASLTWGIPLTIAQATEADAIDALKTKCMLKAEKKCRSLKMGGVDFSEATEQPRRCIRFWELAIKRRQGKRVSSRHWARRKKKANMICQRTRKKEVVIVRYVGVDT